MLVLELGQKERIERLLFAPDGRSLVAPYGSGIYVWRTIADGQRPEKISMPSYVCHVHFTPDGRWLFASCSGLHKIDFATGQTTATHPWAYFDGKFAVSPTAPLLLMTRPAPTMPSPANQTALWRWDDFTEKGKVWEREAPGYAHRLNFFPNGDRFVHIEGGWTNVRSRCEFHAITYEVATGDFIEQSDLITVGGGCFSPNGMGLVLCTGSQFDVLSISPGGGKPIRVRSSNRKHITDTAFHPSGKYFATTSNDETVKIFDTATWQEVRTFTWKLKRMRSIAFSSDGTLAAAGSEEGKVVVWDVDL
jgi:WD40 repeat protein